MSTAELEARGWVKLPFHSSVEAWARHILPIAAALSQDPAEQGKWLRHGGTWFAGVNSLPNDADGRVGNGPALPEPLRAVLKENGLPLHLDQAQISVTYPGYPMQDPDESDAAHRFRRNRDAAHVDGLLPEGPQRRRFLREPHAYVLGIPLTHTDPGASPMVIWEGSHHDIARGFRAHLARFPGAAPETVDMTDAYQAIRAEIFETRPRVVVHAEPGEAYLVHRLALHGVSPWAPGAYAPPEGRMILYFRPPLPDFSTFL